MKKQIKKKFLKEWVELTLCDMLDEILQLMKIGKSREEITGVIKRYSTEIYNSQE